MLSEKKIRLMTKAAMIKERDKKGILLSKKFRLSDFIIFQLAKAVIVITVAYVLFLLFLFLLNMEQIAGTNSIDIIIIAFYISLAVYIIVLVITILLTIRSCKNSYEYTIDELKEYKAVMKKLSRYDDTVDKVFSDPSEESV